MVGAGLVLGLVATPPAVAYVNHDCVAMRELEELGAVLPEKTAQLDTFTDIGRLDGTCRTIVGTVLGTELPVKEVATYAASSQADRADLTEVAWAEPGAFMHRRVGDELPDPAPLPTAVERQLSRWMVLPAGVRRVVLFRTRLLDGGADPRCL